MGCSPRDENFVSFQVIHDSMHISYFVLLWQVIGNRMENVPFTSQLQFTDIVHHIISTEYYIIVVNLTMHIQYSTELLCKWWEQQILIINKTYAQL